MRDKKTVRAKRAGAGDGALRKHREAIDNLDREILARLDQRAAHAKAIGKLKAESGGAA